MRICVCHFVRANADEKRYPGFRAPGESTHIGKCDRSFVHLFVGDPAECGSSLVRSFIRSIFFFHLFVRHETVKRRGGGDTDKSFVSPRSSR